MHLEIPNNWKISGRKILIKLDGANMYMKSKKFSEKISSVDYIYQQSISVGLVTKLCFDMLRANENYKGLTYCKQLLAITLSSLLRVSSVLCNLMCSFYPQSKSQYLRPHNYA